jgi:Beta-lactamase
MADVSGTWDARFELVRDTLAQQLELDELGASIVVDIDGRVVVDVWGGWRDLDRRQPWKEDTITNVWSTTKTITNLDATRDGRRNGPRLAGDRVWVSSNCPLPSLRKCVRDRAARPRQVWPVPAVGVSAFVPGVQHFGDDELGRLPRLGWRRSLRADPYR